MRCCPYGQMMCVGKGSDIEENEGEDAEGDAGMLIGGKALAEEEHGEDVGDDHRAGRDNGEEALRFFLPLYYTSLNLQRCTNLGNCLLVLLIVRRVAVPARLILHKGNTLTLMGNCDDRGRLTLYGARLCKRL